jgi:hypothetical protein
VLQTASQNDTIRIFVLASLVGIAVSIKLYSYFKRWPVMAFQLAMVVTALAYQPIYGLARMMSIFTNTEDVPTHFVLFQFGLLRFLAPFPACLLMGVLFVFVYSRQTDDESPGRLQPKTRSFLSVVFSMAMGSLWLIPFAWQTEGKDLMTVLRMLGWTTACGIGVSAIAAILFWTLRRLTGEELRRKEIK